MKNIDLIDGARSNFMKIAPIIDALKDAQVRDGSLRHRAGRWPTAMYSPEQPGVGV